MACYSTLKREEIPRCDATRVNLEDTPLSELNQSQRTDAEGSLEEPHSDVETRMVGAVSAQWG